MMQNLSTLATVPSGLLAALYRDSTAFWCSAGSANVHHPVHGEPLPDCFVPLQRRSMYAAFRELL